MDAPRVASVYIQSTRYRSSVVFVVLPSRAHGLPEHKCNSDTVVCILSVAPLWIERAPLVKLKTHSGLKRKSNAISFVPGLSSPSSDLSLLFLLHTGLTVYTYAPSLFLRFPESPRISSLSLSCLFLSLPLSFSLVQWQTVSAWYELIGTRYINWRPRDTVSRTLYSYKTDESNSKIIDFKF